MTKNSGKRCPHCRKSIEALGRFDSVVSLRERNRGDDRVLETLVSSGLVGFFTGQLAFLAGYPLTSAVQYGLVFGTGVAVFVWALSFDRQPTGEEVNGGNGAMAVIDVEESDRGVVVAKGGTHQLEFVVKNRTSSRWSFIQMPISDGVMREVSRAVLVKGGAFSRPWICSQNKLISQKEYHDLRSILTRYGMLEVIPGNRTKITSVGRSMFRYYADLSPVNMRSD